jgi:hypothetical protein
MKKVKLLLLENPDQEWSKGTEVEFLVEDFEYQQEEDIFFDNLCSLVKPDVQIFGADAIVVTDFVQYEYEKVEVDPK